MTSTHPEPYTNINGRAPWVRWSPTISLGQVMLVFPLIGLLWAAAVSWSHLQETLVQETNARIAADDRAAVQIDGEHKLLSVKQDAAVNTLTVKIDSLAQQRIEDANLFRAALARIESSVQSLTDASLPNPKRKP